MNYLNVYLLMAVIFLCLSAFLFFNVRRLARQSAESVNWPHIDGQISKSEIREDQPGEKWFLGEYSYAVGGIIHKGALNSLGPEAIDFTTMQSMYPVGRTVSVYYEPSMPSVSTLEPGARSKPHYLVIWVIALAGLICLGLAFWNSNS